MEVVSHCALPVAGLVWRPQPGASILTFICKATFALAPGKLSLLADQQPVHEQDRPWSEEVQSLYAASDMAPRKLRADVTLIGAAFSPGGTPVPRLTARLALGEVNKAVEVWCDRTRGADGRVVEGPPFSQMPLLYERAAGGPGTDNPVGMSQQPDAHGSLALPNLTTPGARVGLDAPLAPTGFGPLGARWPARLARLGRHAGDLSPARWNEQPLPADLDMRYFNVAPADQQTALLSGGERLVLSNLHPDHPQLEATFPALHPRAQIRGPGGERTVPMRADTVWIDTSRSLCCVTYRGQVLLSSPGETGWVVVTLDGADALAASDRRPSTDTGSLTGTISADDRPLAATILPRRAATTLPFLTVRDPSGAPREGQPAGGLPFQPSPPPAPIPAPPPPPPSAPWSPPASSFSAEAAPATLEVPPRSPGMIIPMQPLPPAPPPVRLASPAPSVESPWAVPGGGSGAGTIAPLPSPPTASEVRPAKSPAPPSSPAPAREPPDAIDLVHFDAESVPRLRRVPAWRRLLAKLDERAIEPDEEDPAAAKDAMAVEDRREILEILTRGDLADAPALDAAMERALREDGRFYPPLLLVAGELATPFGELETLQATVNTVTPLIGNDVPLRAAVDAAKELLALPPLATAPAVTEALTTRVRDAFHEGKHSVPAGYLDAQSERVLLAQRAYQRRTVLGGRRLRALLSFASAATGAAPVVTYLPDEVAPKLPLFARFKVRLIVRAHHALDQYEPGALALEVLALARLVSPRRPP